MNNLGDPEENGDLHPVPAGEVTQPQPISLLVKLCHWGPIVALSIITLVSTSSILCLLEWWHPMSSGWALCNIVVFIGFNYLVLTNFFAAIEVGPGYVPIGWTPENPDDSQYLQFCEVCQCYKVPRSHHCRKCGRCCMKMDHHCPWINNCTGHRNHGLFMRFLFFAVMGCGHGAAILGPSIYRAIFRVWYIYYGTGSEPLVDLSLYAIFYCIFAFGLAVGVVFAVGFLLIVQLRSVYRNRTAIEDWILTKAKHRDRPEGALPFVFPYDVGWRNHFYQAFTWSGLPRGDGITWDVLDSCDQYTLTVEQIRQKEIKRLHIVEYIAQRPYNGSWFPLLAYGPKVAYCFPLTDEPRLSLAVGDRIMVSRWKRHWIYGDKQLPVSNEDGGGGDHPGKLRERGWFPRRCAVRVKQNDVDLPKLKHPKSE